MKDEYLDLYGLYLRGLLQFDRRKMARMEFLAALLGV